MELYVFLGPTLSVSEARGILDARYLPPVSAGDVASLVGSKPAAIAIIDGYFHQAPAVRHKEILYALSSGVRVFGSSSMGALRAAELACFGMEGVGRVFEMYRSGALEDDDEVAVAHASASDGYRPLSEAMVNIRESLRRAEQAGVISASTHEFFAREAKRRFYPERIWPVLHEEAQRRGVRRAERDALTAFVREHKINLKAEDARSLLRHLAAISATGIDPHVPTFELHVTVHWRDAMSPRPREQPDPT